MKRNLNRSKVILLSAVFAFTACSEEDDEVVEPVVETKSAINLPCDYFSENANAVLVDDPDLPIDYIIDCTVNLSDDVTIEPGVTIAFGQRGGIKVLPNGSLNAVGTTDDTITFTATNNQKGWWGGIEFLSTDEKNEFSHTLIEYAGATLSSGNSINADAALSIDNSASLKLTNSIIQKSSKTGLFIATRGVSGTDQDRIDAIKLQGNTYTENEYPTSIPFYMVGNLDPNADYSGNDMDKVLIHSRIMSGVTISMQALNVPYQSKGRLHLFDGNNPTHLTIEAGVELEMAAGSNFILFNGTNYLTAVGTAAEPIIIRGVDQTPGSWENLRFNRCGPADLSKLEHVEIKHASSDVNNHSGVLNLDFISNELILTLDNVHFSEFTGNNCPIEYSGDLTTLTYSNLSDDDGKLPGCL
jgi:hypothetical protein